MKYRTLFFTLSVYFGFCSWLFGAGITLTSEPDQLYRETGSIVIRWQEPVEAGIRYGLQSGDYPFESTARGTRHLTLIPKDEGMSPGVYYAIVSASGMQSREFVLYIESGTAARMLQPENNSTLSTGAPRFRWDPVSGVPFYHIILSDRPVELYEDDNGDLQLDGGNIIWQAITSEHSAAYGEPDPSGFFKSLSLQHPPLIENTEYNWVVLNNYNNHPGFSSIVQAGVSSFTVDLDCELTPPVNLSPGDAMRLTDETLTFRWDAVADAAAYQLLLSETREQAGSESSYLIWAPITKETAIQVNARQLLRAGHYFWRVIALDQAGRGIGSKLYAFDYDVPQAILHIRTYKTDLSTLPRAEIEIIPEDGSSEVSKLLTTDSGRLDNPVHPGSYRIWARKAGYADTSATVTVEAAEERRVNLVCRELVQSITGRVLDQNGRAVAAARVILSRYPSEENRSTVTDPAGVFSLRVPSGEWYLRVDKEGYQQSDPITIDLSPGERLQLQDIRLLEQKATLWGTVKSSAGRPLANCVIKAASGETVRSTLTGQTGRFELELRADTWWVTAEKTGFSSPSPRRVGLGLGERLGLDPDILLTSDAALVTGFVQSSTSLLAQAEIRAVPLMGRAQRTTSNAVGSFELSLTEGLYTFEVSRSGYRADQYPMIQLADGETVSNMTLKMTRVTGVVEGMVVRSSGEPVQGAIVTCAGAQDTSHIDGSYRLAIPAGEHIIDATAYGMVQTDSQRVSIEPNEVVTAVTLELTEHAGVIEGTILAQGKAVANASITATDGNQRVLTRSDDAGSYWLSVPPGVWTVEVEKPGLAPTALNGIAVSADQVVSGVDVQLTVLQSAVQGQVVDRHNRALNNARVMIVGENRMARTHRDGRFAFGLEPGSYRIRAEKEGYVVKENNMTLKENQHRVVNFSLDPKALFYGTILDDNGLELKGVTVTAQGADTVSTLTDFAGEYRLFSRSGTVFLQADALGYHNRERQYNISLGDSIPADFILTRAPSEIAVLSGMVRNSTDQPLRGVRLYLSARDDHVLLTDLNGRYESQALQAGFSVSLRPSHPSRFFVPPQRLFDPLPSSQSGQNFLAGYYGDVSANEQVSAFDGSLILRKSAEQDVSPHFTRLPRDTVAADVSGNHQISPFDASLIFRYSAGLLDRFPVQEKRLAKPVESATQPLQLALESQPVEPGILRVGVSVDEVRELYSGLFDLQLSTSNASLVECQKTPLTRQTRIETNQQENRIRVAMASTHPIQAGGVLFYLLVRAPSLTTVRFSHVSLNEGLIPVSFAALNSDPTVSQFSLLDNYPNPFNAITEIHYELPTLTQRHYDVEITIFDLLGRVIRRIPMGMQSGGRYRVIWKGRNDRGEAVPSGLYFYRLKAGTIERRKKCILLR